MGKSGKIPLKQALLWVSASTLICTSIALLLWAMQRRYIAERTKSEHYVIQKVLARGQGGPPLSTECLCALMDLSADQPTDLLSFDVLEGKRRLLASGLFKTVELSVAPPSLLIVDFQARSPVAYLAEYSNIALDAEGRAFPVRPYLEPTALSLIALGLPQTCDPLHLPMPEFSVQVALQLLGKLKGWPVRCIDCSRLGAASFGQREIVVRLEESCGSRLLRLNPDQIEQGLANYVVLRDRLESGSTVIDLRSDRIALIQTVGDSG